MSDNILLLIAERSVFDSDATAAMGQAYDKVRLLHVKSQPHLVKEAIATRIFQLAKSGERDPGRMCHQVLEAFGLAMD